MLNGLFLVLFSCIVLLPSIVSAYSFAQNLRLGDNSQDVQQLQIFLNKSSDTQVAQSGVGSIGNESTYFGALTLKAVMNFQAKYKSEILDSSGLTAPTGFVGPATLRKINSLSSNLITNTQPALINRNISQIPAVSMPIVSGISKVSVSAGDTLVITGRFSGTSVAHFDDNVAVNSKVVSPTEIDTIVPNITGIPLVWVSNEYGDSRADFPMFVSVGGNTSSDILNGISARNDIIHSKAIDPANQ